MQTTINIDESLLQEIVQYTNKKTYEDAVTIALQTFVKTQQRHDLRELRGKIKMSPEYDYKAMREGTA